MGATPSNPIEEGPSKHHRALVVLRDNWFVTGLLGVILLAWLFPELGARDGPLRTETTTRFGIAAIFLLQGLTLPLAALVSGATNLRLHLLIQSVTFVVLPALGILANACFGAALPSDLRIGLLYLCVLPSTIKTAIVFTSLAGGNAAAAIFSATLSSLFGVLATPLWVQWLTRASHVSIELGAVLAPILSLLILPFALGLALQRPLERWGKQLKAASTPIASSVVLFIVYAAFCDSISDGTWQSQSLTTSLVALLLALGLFSVATALTLLGARSLGLSRDDTVTALFCAPQKTLASGAPLAQLVFPGQNVGLILLPLLFYHPLQLLLGGLLASNLARRKRPRAASACA